MKVKIGMGVKCRNGRDWGLEREKGTLREEVTKNANQAYEVEYWIRIINSYTNSYIFSK